MKHIAASFVFSPELGARLRELRKQAGLSITELAYMMGRTVGYHQRLGRLEAGKLRYPSMALVADYLRACRSSFAVLVPLLNGYTGRLPVRESRGQEQLRSALVFLRGREIDRLQAYDRKVATARSRQGKRQLAPEARVRAVKLQGQAVLERRVLDKMVKELVNELEVKPTLPVRLAAHDYSWMVWKAMKRTQGREAEGEETEGEKKSEVGSQEAEVRTAKTEGSEEGARSEAKAQEAEGKAKDAEVKSQGAGGAENHPHPLPPPQGGGNEREGRPRRGRPRKTREARLAETEARMRELAPGVLPARALRQIRDRVVLLYEDMHRWERKK